ncbi:MAG: signal peptidase I [Buchnera aphidicola (Periphyllus lyropictus)]|nr:signal peptidase I [Buchnera aphidicola]NIH16618.1 signal peptidase I [Buchnera aphidicola (Periphyllus lyropictus)]USS94530.1 signal peptidase I [Buchnera aphidicola (Periphyllus lyropictus)]
MYNFFYIFLLSLIAISGLFWLTEKIKIFYYKLKYSKQQEKYTNNNPNSIAELFPTLFFIFIFRFFIFEPFQIPSSSMMPTLLSGDFILVQKFFYNLKNPLNNKILFTLSHPHRGDVVVFQLPEDKNKNYVKRVIGIEGDVITYDSSTKTISLIHKYSNFKKSIQLIKYKDFKNLKKNLKKYSNNQGYYLDERNSSKTYKVLLVKGKKDDKKNYFKQKNEKIGKWVVPKGCFFVMGDNRDNSFDSRYWGFIPESNLIGKVNIIWFSFRKKENKWPIGIRFNRIGKIVY